MSTSREDLEIARMLVISTKHLKPDPIENRAEPTFNRAEGCLFFVPDKADESAFFYPFEVDDVEDVIAAFELARSQECKWVMFDRDGDVVEGLKEWEWP